MIKQLIDLFIHDLSYDWDEIVEIVKVKETTQYFSFFRPFSTLWKSDSSSDQSDPVFDDDFIFDKSILLLKKILSKVWLIEEDNTLIV